MNLIRNKWSEITLLKWLQYHVSQGPMDAMHASFYWNTIGSDNGLSPVGRHVTLNDGLLLIWLLGTNFNRNLNIFIHENTYENIVCLNGLNMLMTTVGVVTYMPSFLYPPSSSFHSKGLRLLPSMVAKAYTMWEQRWGSISSGWNLPLPWRYCDQLV